MLNIIYIFTGHAYTTVAGLAELEPKYVRVIASNAVGFSEPAAAVPQGWSNYEVSHHQGSEILNNTLHTSEANPARIKSEIRKHDEPTPRRWVETPLYLPPGSNVLFMWPLPMRAMIGLEFFSHQFATDGVPQLDKPPSIIGVLRAIRCIPKPWDGSSARAFLFD